MGELVLLILPVLLVLFYLIIHNYKKNRDDGYNRGTDNYNRNPYGYDRGSQPKEEKKSSKPGFFSSLFGYEPMLPFDEEAITWCAQFVGMDEKEFKAILRKVPMHYSQFSLRKRSGGYRTISAPQGQLLWVQRTIYKRILLPVNLHPAAKGFRHKVSIVDNAKPHLGKDNVLKVDIMDFFGSIKLYTVIEAFKKIGYPQNISEVLAALCCLNKRLPQGAPTSPALSNIVAYGMDQKLAALSGEYELTYTRYADDLTFSGDSISQDVILPKIAKILKEEGFALKIKKTRYLPQNRRKIITGISISSGEKLTIPKAKKREVRQNVHYILKRGLSGHQRHIKSSDPAYLKRLLGYLSFWHSVEPDNKYVIDSLKALRRLEKRNTI